MMNASKTISSATRKQIPSTLPVDMAGELEKIMESETPEDSTDNILEESFTGESPKLFEGEERDEMNRKRNAFYSRVKRRRRRVYSDRLWKCFANVSHENNRLKEEHELLSTKLKNLKQQIKKANEKVHSLQAHSKPSTLPIVVLPTVKPSRTTLPTLNALPPPPAPAQAGISTSQWIQPTLSQTIMNTPHATSHHLLGNLTLNDVSRLQAHPFLQQAMAARHVMPSTGLDQVIEQTHLRGILPLSPLPLATSVLDNALLQVTGMQPHTRLERALLQPAPSQQKLLNRSLLLWLLNEERAGRL